VPERAEFTLDNFRGEDRQLDPAQLGDGARWQLNWEIEDKGTALKTRPGWGFLAAGDRYGNNDLPALLSIYAKDKGFQGILVAVVAGHVRERGIAIGQHVFDDGSVFGSALSRVVTMYPQDASATYWPRGADLGTNEFEQVDWRASLTAAFGRLLVFQPHQVPVHVYPSGTANVPIVRTLGIDRPVLCGAGSFTDQDDFQPTVATGAAGNLTGDYRYVLTLKNKDDKFPTESPGSLPSASVSPSSEQVNISAANVDWALHPSSAVTHVGIYRKKVNDTELWSHYYWVADVALATFESSGYSDNVEDGTVLSSEILDEAKYPMRGFGYAHFHKGRLYAGNQADWSGLADMTQNNYYATLKPSAGTPGDSRYSDFIQEGRRVVIAGTTYTILKSFQDGSGNNRIYLADTDQAQDVDAYARFFYTPKQYTGTTLSDAAARIPGNKRTIFASYYGAAYCGYRHVLYEIVPGQDTDGELTGLGTMRDALLGCYEKALFLIHGGDFADNAENGNVFPDWQWRYISNGIGLAAPKTLSWDADGNAYGYGGPNGGVWTTDGLSIRSISDSILERRLLEFADQKFAVGGFDHQKRVYRLFFPHSLDGHGFAFSFDTGDWWETNHVAPMALANQSPVAAGTIPAFEEVVEDDIVNTWTLTIDIEEV